MSGSSFEAEVFSTSRRDALFAPGAHGVIPTTNETSLALMLTFARESLHAPGSLRKPYTPIAPARTPRMDVAWQTPHHAGRDAPIHHPHPSPMLIRWRRTLLSLATSGLLLGAGSLSAQEPPGLPQPPADLQVLDAGITVLHANEEALERGRVVDANDVAVAVDADRHVGVRPGEVVLSLA